MTLRRWDPFTEALALRENMNRLLGESQSSAFDKRRSRASR